MIFAGFLHGCPPGRSPLKYAFPESVQRGLPLNLARVDSDSGEVEACKTRDLHRIQFGGIEPPPHGRKSPSQCPMNRGFCRSAKCLRRVRIRQPHKVPANAADCGIQLHCHSPHRLGPSIGKRLPTQSELTRQGTSIPQEDRVDLHCCRIPGGLSNRFRRESDGFGIESKDALEEECPEVRTFAEVGALLLSAADLIPATPGALSGPVLPCLMARRAAK